MFIFSFSALLFPLFSGNAAFSHQKLDQPLEKIRDGFVENNFAYLITSRKIYLLENFASPKLIFSVDDPNTSIIQVTYLSKYKLFWISLFGSTNKSSEASHFITLDGKFFSTAQPHNDDTGEIAVFRNIAATQKRIFLDNIYSPNAINDPSSALLQEVILIPDQNSRITYKNHGEPFHHFPDIASTYLYNFKKTMLTTVNGDLYVGFELEPRIWVYADSDTTVAPSFFKLNLNHYNEPPAKLDKNRSILESISTISLIRKITSKNKNLVIFYEGNTLDNAPTQHLQEVTTKGKNVGPPIELENAIFLGTLAGKIYVLRKLAPAGNDTFHYALEISP